MTRVEGGPGGIAVLIPAFRPDHRLAALAGQLAAEGFRRIVVVDDGSGPGCRAIFESVSAIGGVEVVRHGVNQGKGAALKTGIRHILDTVPEIAGIVTADADGQHLAEDILRVALRFQEQPDALVLGSRAFDGAVPLRSRFGNAITRDLMLNLSGLSLTDTQTGLRALPAPFAASLANLSANGYEFEAEMLIAARQGGVELIEEPIRTVYEDRNSSSHFKPCTDSLKICSAFLRLPLVLLTTAALNYLIFFQVWHRGRHATVAYVFACAATGVFNYFGARWALFRTGGGSAEALSRFIPLALATAAVGWLGLWFGTRALQLPVLTAQIAMANLLFWVNLALQRDWVFLQPAAPRACRSLSKAGSWQGLLLWLLLLVPLAVEVFGFRLTNPWSHPSWLPAGSHRFGDYLRFWFGACVLFGLLARRFFFPAVAAGVVFCSIYAVGTVPVGIVLLFVFSATVLGRLAFGEETEGPLALLAGIAFWMAAMYLTARLPVHYATAYLAALGVPVAAGYRISRRLAVSWAEALRPRVRLSLTEFGAAALLAFLLTANWLVALKPEVSADGLAMHLAIPADLALHHAYTIDFRRLIWALMPIGADLIYSVVYLPGGEYAARLLNFVLLSGMALLLFQAVRTFLPRAAALLLTALFVSTPMVYLVTGSMFVENFVAFMVLGAAVALWRACETQSARNAMLAAALLGASMALKLGAVAAGLPGLFLLLFQIVARADRSVPLGRRARLAVAVAALALTLGSIPYAIAWKRTGNPFFPFETGPFKSSFVGNDIRDQTYNHPLTWRTPYDLTFRTNRYYEGEAGSFGFQYLLFLPLAAGTLFLTRSFRARTAIALAAIPAAIVAATQPNARYFYFTMPLFTIGAAAGLGWIRERDRALSGSFATAAVLAVLANIWFLPTADWYNRDFYSSPLFSAAGRRQFLHENAPVREVVSWLNGRDRDQPVLFAEASDIAGLARPVHLNNWHDYAFVKKMQAAAHPRDALAVLRNADLQWMVVDRADPGAPEGDPMDPLGIVVSTCGQEEFSSGRVTVMRLSSDCESVLPDTRPECAALQPLTRKDPIDDSDTRIDFLGKWLESHPSPASNRTLHSSNAPRAAACFNIEGTGFEYVHTVAPDRGIAQILVDGRQAANVDLYSPEMEWQVRTPVSGLGPGRHEIAIRILRRRNEASRDSFVDLDAIRVF